MSHLANFQQSPQQQDQQILTTNLQQLNPQYQTQNLNINSNYQQSNLNQQQYGYSQPQVGGYQLQQQQNIQMPQQQLVGGGLSELSPEKQAQLKRDFEMATTKVNPNELSSHHIFLSISGTIEEGDCRNEQSLQIKYDIEKGKDWQQISGLDSGISQMASSSSIYSNNITWNFPFDAVFEASNPMGWPQIIISAYGNDFLGRQVLKGYGSVHIPTQPGYHERTVYLYKPLPQNWLIGLYGFFIHQNPEFRKPEKTISTGEGREVIRVSSSGKIKIKFQVLQRNMKYFGYAV